MKNFVFALMLLLVAIASGFAYESPSVLDRAQPVAVEAEPTPAVSANRVFQLRRETKLAGLRVAIKQRAERGTRSERRLFNRVLADPDMMELALAHVEWLETQDSAVSAADDETERRPIQEFLQFIIDNWDQIKQIIEFVSGLFGDVPVSLQLEPLQEQWAVDSRPVFLAERRIA